MYWVITILLMFEGSVLTLEREYKLKQFNDDWGCHKFIYQNKTMLLEQHFAEFGSKLKSWELYCESRYGEEV
jgi:hypothetical protein